MAEGERHVPQAGVLDGVHVLDFTRIVAGPWCTMLLGDFGADVVKIESDDGDLSRTWGRARFGPADDMSGLFVAANRNKRSLALNLRHPDAPEIITRLIRWADVLVQSYRPDTADAMGIGYEEAKKLKPELIYCSVSGFGQNGPLRDHPGQDALLQAYAGISSITGEPGRPAVRVGPPAVDMMTATQAALGIVLALFDQTTRGTNEGQLVDTSLYDSALSFMTMWIAEYSGTGVVPEKFGCHNPAYVPGGNFTAGDGREFHMALVGEGNWRKFCDLAGLVELVEDPRFRTHADRVLNQDELYVILYERIRSKTAAEWVELAQREGITASLIYNVAEVVEQPQAAARDAIIELPGLNRVKVGGIPVKLERTPGSVRRPPPMLGEHSEMILSEVGYSVEEIAAFIEAGSVSTPAMTSEGSKP